MGIIGDKHGRIYIKDYTKAIRVLESTTDMWDDEFKITPEEFEKLMKSVKPMVIKSCPHLLPCGCCEKRDGLLCSQYK